MDPSSPTSPPSSARKHANEIKKIYAKAAEYRACRIEAAVEAYEDRVWLWEMLRACRGRGRQRARATMDRVGLIEAAMEVRIAEMVASEG
jgi:hypothetical protein